MSGRAEFTDAVLVRSVDYGESDRIVTLLTRDHGKVALIARGARRSKKRFQGSLEPFLVVSAEIALGKGEVGRLSQAIIKQAFPKILSSLARMSAAGLALELVRDAVPVRAPDARVFHATTTMFETCEEVDGTERELVLAFACRLVAVLGFAPQLSTCGRCGKEAPRDKSAYFDPRMGSVVCRACGGGPLHLSAEARARMLASFGSKWPDMAKAAWPAKTALIVEKVLTAVLSEHLGRHVSLSHG